MSDTRSFCMIKPDAISRGVVGKIISALELNGFCICRMEMKWLTREEASRFYGVHKDRSFFPALVTFVTSGPVIGIELKGEDAVNRLRKLIGATDPEKAEEGTLRKLYGTDIRHNAVHASDSPESYKRESAIFFGDKD